MSLKAIITTLILGTSSLAAADTTIYAQGHVDVRDHRTNDRLADNDRVDVRDHRSMIRPMPVVYQPVTLASSMRINGKDVIRVSDAQRPFTKLELQSNSGRTKLDKVVITFGNGQTQVIDCDRILTGKESFSIDLAGNQRNIKRLVLVGNSGRRASINVIAV